MNERTFRASSAHKLEDPRRLEWLPPADLLRALHPLAGTTVADIGAGTGYFTLPLATLTGGPELIYAVDIQPEMLALLRQKLDSDTSAKIRLIEGSAARNALPTASCDLLLLANIWHELDDRPTVLAECRRTLKPSGRLAILDWSPDVDPTFGPPLHHRISPAAVVSELEAESLLGIHQQNIGLYSYLVTAHL